jgi:hypothetical protein
MGREPPVSLCSKILTTSGNPVDECYFPDCTITTDARSFDLKMAPVQFNGGISKYEIKLKERQIPWQPLAAPLYK